MIYDLYEVCRADLRTLTYAQKAQRLLTSSAIPARLIRLEGAGGRGCSYGIEIPCNQTNNAQSILSSQGITVKKWNRQD